MAIRHFAVLMAVLYCVLEHMHCAVSRNIKKNRFLHRNKRHGSEDVDARTSNDITCNITEETCILAGWLAALWAPRDVMAVITSVLFFSQSL